MRIMNEATMRLFSYVLSVDDGAAPNPFWGYCTLAICKPVIRRVAHVGDWVIGIGPAGKSARGKLIYAMRVDEVLPLDAYFTEPRFQEKKPQDDAPDTRRHVGDNVYFKARGRWKKLPGGIHAMFGQVPDVLEDVWIDVALGQIERAKKVIAAVPEKHPFNIRYERIEKTDWESCEKVLSADAKWEALRHGW